MSPLKTKKKLKELEALGLSRNKIAKFTDISPSALSRFLKGERSGLNIAAKILSFITGTNRLGKFKVKNKTKEVLSIKKHPNKGKTKIYGTLSPDEESLSQIVISEVNKVLKTRKGIKELPNKLKKLSKELSKKYQNRTQIPYWIGLHLFEVYQTSNGSGYKKELNDLPLYCQTYQQELIILRGIRDILKDLLIKIDPVGVSWKEIDYRMQAANLDGVTLLYEEKPAEAPKSFLKGLQLGINWIGSQENISKTLNYRVWENLLEIALNNLNNALYSCNPKLIADSKNFFLLLDKNFYKPKNAVGEAVFEKVYEVMREHQENNLPSDPNSIPFNYFLKEYKEAGKYFLEKFLSKKEGVLV